jgi:hypothetical protein
MSTSYATDVQ